MAENISSSMTGSSYFGDASFSKYQDSTVMKIKSLLLLSVSLSLFNRKKDKLRASSRQMFLQSPSREEMEENRERINISGAHQGLQCPLGGSGCFNIDLKINK